MMKEIKIIDDFFSQDIIDKIKLAINAAYKCGCLSRVKNNRYGAHAYWSINLINDVFFSIDLKNIIEKHLNDKYILRKLILLAGTFGQDATYHTDHEFKSLLDFQDGQDFDNKEITFCYYLNDNDHEISGGNLYFKVPSEKYIVCVEPKNNRGVFFPAYLNHKPTGFNRFISDTRICISFKFFPLL